MASRRGIIATAGILGAITIASFAVWYIPQDSRISFTVSDFGAHLDSVKAIRGTIDSSLHDSYQGVIDGETGPAGYVENAEASSSQINSLIIEMIDAEPDGQWAESYIEYLESLRSLNSQIRESIVHVRLIQDGAAEDDLRSAAERTEQFRLQSERAAGASDAARP